MHLDELSVQLRLFNSAFHKALRKEMAEASSYSMTEMETLFHIFKTGKTLPTDLATITRISTPSMSQILKKMEADGIIKRIPAEDDKRKVHVSLTTSGKELVENLRDSKDEYLKKLIPEKLSAKEIALLKNAIPVLNKLIS